MGLIGYTPPKEEQCYPSKEMSNRSMNQSCGTSPATETTFEGGTKRSGRKPPYHLVPVELMEAVAATRVDGDRRYAPGNWMQGSREFWVDCLGHAIEHLM